MIRGTAQPFKFTLSCRNNELDWAMIRFWQPTNPSQMLPIIKQLDDCGPRDNYNNLDGTNILSVSLTAEETAYFSDKYKAVMQMRACPIGGSTFGSKPHFITVYPMDDDLIGEYPTIPPANEDQLVVFDGDNVLSDEVVIVSLDGSNIE